MCTFLSTTIVLSFQLVENVVNDLVIAVQNFRFILLSDLNAYFLQLIAKYRDWYTTVFQLLILMEAVLALGRWTV